MLRSLLSTLRDRLANIPPLQSSHAYLKSQVLQEVCGAISLVGFCPATGIYPYANSRGLRPWRMLCRNLHRISG